jgi:hypothetical protein
MRASITSANYNLDNIDNIDAGLTFAVTVTNSKLAP